MQLIEPRQALAIKAYTDPTSPTFSNLKQSMISAGFSESYADTVSGQYPEWLTETLQDTVEMIQSAQNNLKRYSKMVINVEDKNAIDWARLQVDVSKYITKTLASKKYSEDKTAEVPNVQINIVNYGEKPKEPIDVEPK